MTLRIRVGSALPQAPGAEAQLVKWPDQETMIWSHLALPFFQLGALGQDAHWNSPSSPGACVWETERDPAPLVPEQGLGPHSVMADIFTHNLKKKTTQ